MAANFGEELERRVGGLLDRIPGYRGYRAKEDRRDADRRVREHLVTAYDAQADRIERVARDLAARRRLQDIGPVDEFARTLRHFIDRVRTATYGYGGLMGDRDVDAQALDQLRLFDEGLLSGFDELAKPIGDLETALAANGELATPARAGSDVVRRLLARFDLRGEVVETGKAAPQESVMLALQPPRSDEAAPGFDLRQGDALAILGDDFLVDGVVAVEGGAVPLRLFRLGATPERWLAVARGPWGMALLTPATAPATGSETALDGTTYTAEVAGSGDGEATGAGGASGSRPVRFWLLIGANEPAARGVVLDWGSERQAYAGRAVHPNDVEVFGRPSDQIN
ncbi:MAG: hypothetical protein M3Q10_02635 [Chloroflexota bacterium]|nr:hypothetical protein [Chloroflexota bacterium]